jgi:hypothetical protein
MPIDYPAWYANAAAELGRVREEKAELQRELVNRDRQIAALIQTINAIAPLVGKEAVSPPAGLTASIRAILAEAAEPLSAAGIRDRLQAIGFDMRSYSNPLATIHTVLRRLLDAREVQGHYQTGAEGQSGKRFLALNKELPVEKIAGFDPGKKGLIGVGGIRRRRKPREDRP